MIDLFSIILYLTSRMESDFLWLQYNTETGKGQEKIKNAANDACFSSLACVPKQRIDHSRYPGDYEIRYNLAVCLYHLWDENHTAELFDEMETLCSSVIAECRNENTRYDAIRQHPQFLSVIDEMTPYAK